ncbi:MAG TPA: phosphomannomutase/phosphoglucomutase [Nitrospirae bacterium]|nr:phosphomannomutase/phosphoglucomutase [Nitrospirota bacterium]
MNEKIFREYDIRGVAGRDLTVELAFSLGRAFGSYLRRLNPKAKCITVGRDARISSGELAGGMIEGVISSCIDVVDVGLCPTPLQYFSLFHLDTDGGVMVTGSHNPPQYNGFKLSVGKETIFGDSIQRLKDILLNKEWSECQHKGSITKYDIISAYKEFIISRFSYLSDGKYRRLKIVADAGNGTAGLVVPELLDAIGCDVMPLYCEPDGRFPNHHPDPTVVEYIEDLIKTTKTWGADLGVGYDGDADRIGVVDATGDIIWGDQIMIVLSRDILKRVPGAVIVGDVKCSQVMFDDIERHGGRPIMWKTGHSLVKDKMKKEGAVLAGEFSGHIFISDGYFGYDDAVYTTMRIIEIMKTRGMSMKELLSDVPRMHYTPEIRIECPEERKKSVVQRVVKRFQEQMASGNGQIPIKHLHDIDGVRVVFDRGWGLVRASNTQPVVVMRVEAEDEESLKDYKALLDKELKDAMEVR